MAKEKFKKVYAAKQENAYLSVHLALWLTVLLPLCLLLIDGARRNGAALEATYVTEVSMQSILAEYHRELLEQYNIFAIDCSYGTDSAVKRNTEAHLYQYLEKNLERSGRDLFSVSCSGAELTGVSILSDESGAVFRSCAVEAVKDDVGLELLDELMDWVDTVENENLEDNSARNEKENLDREIEEYEGDSGDGEVAKIDNPTDGLEAMRGWNILTTLLLEDKEFSEKIVNTDALIGARSKAGQVSTGNLVLSDDADSLVDKFFFQEYCIRYMGNYTDPKQEGALEYQLEYLVAGQESDTGNLEAVAWRLSALREAANLIYIYSDSTKCLEAEVLATTVCLLAFAPEMIPTVKNSILMSWAYAESLYDVKALLEGGKIPLLKTSDTWHLSLTNALSGMFSEEQETQGLDYEDYLRVIMMLMDLDTLTVRAMDMVEADIRLTEGNENFRMDGCYSTVQAKLNFESGHGYAFEAVRKRSYLEQ